MIHIHYIHDLYDKSNDKTERKDRLNDKFLDSKTKENHY